MAVKSVIVIDVEEVLNTLGINNVKRVGEEVNYSCPGSSHRHGDHRPSAYMRASGHINPYICFGCGAQGTVVDFVADYLGIDRAKAWRWLGERYGFDAGYDPEESITETLSRVFNNKPKIVYKVLGNDVIEPKGFVPLQSVSSGNDYILRRGLTQETINFFELQWDSRTGRVAIPIRDRLGNIVGFKARDITGEREPKYLVLGDRENRNDYGFPPYNSSLVLFGHNLVPEDETDLIIVEGEFNAMKCRQEGTGSVVGLPTASMSEHQSCIIREGYENVILFLDSDEAGRKGTSKALNMLGSACNVRVVPEHEGDPMEMNREQINEHIQNAENPLLNTLRRIN